MEREHRRRDVVTAAVLAGGRSRRMGRDKRGLFVDGQPMLRRAVLAVAEVADEVLVACRRDDPPDPGILEGLAVRLVFDAAPGAGPLAGLEAALAAAGGDLVLVVAGDMPWLEPRVLRLLVAEATAHPDADAVALATPAGVEPLLAVYRQRVLPIVRSRLGSGKLRMHDLLASLATLEMPAERWRGLDPDGLTARNANEPADLR